MQRNSCLGGANDIFLDACVRDYFQRAMHGRAHGCTRIRGLRLWTEEILQRSAYFIPCESKSIGDAKWCKISSIEKMVGRWGYPKTMEVSRNSGSLGGSVQPGFFCIGIYWTADGWKSPYSLQPRHRSSNALRLKKSKAANLWHRLTLAQYVKSRFPCPVWPKTSTPFLH